ILIHIYDCAGGTPTSSVGTVTISGHTNSDNVTSVAVLVAASGQAWSEAPSLPLNAGCVNLAGFVADDQTRPITRASIAVSGNIEHHADMIARSFRRKVL